MGEKAGESVSEGCNVRDSISHPGSECVRGPGVKAGRQPLEAGKNKEPNSLQGLRNGAHPCQHLDLSLVRPISDF